MNLPYEREIKILVCVVFVAAWTYGAYYTGQQLERAAWERKESAKKDRVIEGKVESEKVSQDAGQKYEKKRDEIQRKLTTPDRSLDDELHGPAGDIELPASLGVRLNALTGANQAQPSASQPDARVRSDAAVP